MSTGCTIGDPEAGDNDTPLPGTCAQAPSSISDDTTFSAGCYEFDDTLDVEAGTLTIEPGTTLMFGHDTGLRVEDEGRLNAEGTDDDPIIMSSHDQDRGFWRGIFFNESRSANNVLQNVEISYGGGHGWTYQNRGPGNVVINDSQVHIEDVELTESGGNGLWLRATEDVTLSGNNVLTANADAPVNGSARTIAALNSDSDYSDNDGDYSAIKIRGGDLSGDARWDEFNVPLLVDTDIDIEGGTLEIAPGNDLIFTGGSGLRVEDDGRLNAEGTDDDPIVMSGDETTSGYWRGIFFNDTNSSDNVLHHVTITDGGGHEWTYQNRGPGNVVVSNARVELDEVTLENSGYAGLWIRATEDVTLTGDSLLTDNEGPPVSGSSRTIASLNAESDYSGNHADDSAIEVRGGDLGDDAQWPQFNVPVRVDTVIEIDGGTLEVAEGNELIFTQDAGLRVEDDGRLNMTATDGAPIELRGDEELAGYWRGIYFKDTVSSDNHLEYVEIRDGGGHAWTYQNRGPANLVIDDSHVSADELTLTNSDGYGVYLQSDPTFDCQNLTNDDGWNVSEPPC